MNRSNYANKLFRLRESPDNFMSPFINLTKSSQYGGSEDYLVNVNHIVRIVKATGGSQVFTLGGEFFCDESPAQLELLISYVFDQNRRVISGN